MHEIVYSKYAVNKGDEIMDMTRMGTSRSKSWTKEQRLEFGRRLTWARDRAGYGKASLGIKAIEDRWGVVVARTYYSHEAGERVPDNDEMIEIYAQTYNVPTAYLLLRQTEPESSEVVRKYVNHASVNQAIEPFDVNSSQIMELRYISILTASDIRDLLTGAGKLRTMSRGSLPLPPHVAAGPKVIAYQIPDYDDSMVGPDGSLFSPRATVFVDLNAEIAPGHYLMALLANTQTPVLRRLQSPYPYVSSAPRYPFKLIAHNPMVEPLTIQSADDCRIVGRVIFVGTSV